MKKADFIVIAVVAVVVGVLVFVLYGLNNGTGDFVQVEIDGRLVDTVSLNESFEKEYKTAEGRNVLVIKDGKAEITEADCPDGICAKHSAVSRSGESIICLPHKLVVTVIDADDNNAEIDAVA